MTITEWPDLYRQIELEGITDALLNSKKWGRECLEQSKKETEY